MADDDVQIRAVSLNGACELRIAGELDMMAADALAGRARAAVEAVPGSVLVDLSGLTFIDLHGARALDELVRTLADGRPTAVCRCPLRVRRVLDLLGLTLDGLPAGDWTVPQTATPSAADRVRRARLDSAGSRQNADGTLTRVANTCIRLASTIERTGLLREQGCRIVASSRATRQYRIPSRQGTLA